MPHESGDIAHCCCFGDCLCHLCAMPLGKVLQVALVLLSVNLAYMPGVSSSLLGL